MKKYSIVFYLFITVLLFAQESIDVYNKDAGKFLDFDLIDQRNKAWASYQSGDFEEAAKNYLFLLQHDISDNNSIYNLACCYGLLGNEELAAVYVEKAFKSGFNDINHIKNDSDFDKVKDAEAFQNVLKSITEISEKEKPKDVQTIFTAGSVMQKGLISLPDNYDPENEYTLLVGLHGLGGIADKFIRHLTSIEQENFIIATPEAPYAFMVGKDIGYSWNIRIKDKEIEKSAGGMSEEYIVAFISSVKDQHKIKDVYMLGFSQGAYFSFYFGIKHPNLITGIIPFGGGMIDDWKDELDFAAARDLRIFLAHGNKDNVVKFENGTKARDLLEKNGLTVNFVEFDGAHQVPVDVLKQAYGWIEKR